MFLIMNRVVFFRRRVLSIGSELSHLNVLPLVKLDLHCSTVG